VRRNRRINTDYLKIGSRLQRIAEQQGNGAFDTECRKAAIGTRMGRNYRDVAVAVDEDRLMSESDALDIGATKAQLIVVKCRHNRKKAREAIRIAKEGSMPQLRRFLETGSQTKLSQIGLALTSKERDDFYGWLMRHGATPKKRGVGLDGVEEALMRAIRRKG
jgi:sulfite reductase beta subunit-like hemoprotein